MERATQHWDLHSTEAERLSPSLTGTIRQHVGKRSQDSPVTGLQVTMPWELLIAVWQNLKSWQHCRNSECIRITRENCLNIDLHALAPTSLKKPQSDVQDIFCFCYLLSISAFSLHPANPLLQKDMLFSRRYKPGVRTPTLLQINTAQLWWGSWIPRLQADLTRQSCEPLFLTENNSSLFTASPVNPLLKSFPLPRSQEGWIKTQLSLPWTSIHARFCSSTATWAGHRLYFKN